MTLIRNLGFFASKLNSTGQLDGETYSTSATVTAGANTQGSVSLTSDFSIVTTTAANPSGITLPTATVGRRIIIVNKGTNTVNVYPATSGKIDALATNASISIPVDGWMEFNASSTTQWYSTYNITLLSSGGVTTFQTSLSGLTPSSATSGAITLAGTLGVSSGGTGTSTAPTQYGVIYASTTTAYSSTAAGTGTQVLHGNAAGAPTWSAVSLTADVSGVLPLANGGTNANLTATAGGIVYSTASALAISVAGSANQVLLSGGTGTPTWASQNTITAGSVQNSFVIKADTGTTEGTDLYTFTGSAAKTLNIVAGTNITITKTAGQWSIAAAGGGGGVTSITGTANQVLANSTSGSAQTGAVTLTLPQNIHSGATPTFAGLTLTAALPATSGGTGQNTYTIGDILYASTTSALSKLTAVAAGSYLRSAGTGTAPAWSTLTLPNTATTGQLLYASATNTIGALNIGTTAGQLLRVNSGLTAPEWFTPSYQSAPLFINTSAVGPTNLTTETIFTGYAGTSINIPASAIAVNKIFRLSFYGTYTTGGTSARLTINIRAANIGVTSTSNIIATSGTPTIAPVTSQSGKAFFIQCEFFYTSVTTNFIIKSTSRYEFTSASTGATGAQTSIVVLSPSTTYNNTAFNPSSGLNLGISMAWATAVTTSQLTISHATLEYIN